MYAIMNTDKTTGVVSEISRHATLDEANEAHEALKSNRNAALYAIIDDENGGEKFRKITYTVYKCYNSFAPSRDTFYDEYAAYAAAKSEATAIMLEEQPDCDEDALEELDCGDYVLKIICSENVIEEEEADDDNPAGTGHFELVDDYLGYPRNRQILWRQFE